MNPITGEYDPIRTITIREAVIGRNYYYRGFNPNIPKGTILGILYLKRLLFEGDKKRTNTEYMCKFGNYSGIFETDDLLLEINT